MQNLHKSAGYESQIHDLTWPNKLKFFHFQIFRYIEIELGPHGHHIVLLLDGVRNAVAKLLPIQYEATIGEF